MAAQISAILFDKDGTLFDFHATWGPWARAFLLELCAGDAARAAAIGERLGFDFASGRFAPDSPVIAGSPLDVADAVDAIIPIGDRAAFLRRFDDSAAAARAVPPVPLGPLLEELRGRGLVLGVATNDSRRAALAHLQAEGVADLFDFIAGYDSGFGSKPAPGMLQAFVEFAGLDPEGAAMVGDSTHDLLAATAAGMRRVAVLTGVATADTLAPHADVVLPHVGALPAWLDSQ